MLYQDISRPYLVEKDLVIVVILYQDMRNKNLQTILTPCTSLWGHDTYDWEEVGKDREQTENIKME